VYLFDRKFGEDLIKQAPTTPAVYLFKDSHGSLLYVGKASNIHRRLQQYRMTTRRKAHRKMRRIVRESASLEIIHRESEREALLLENQLIQKYRPPLNKDGAYHFLYPAIGLGGTEKQLLLGFTTQTEAWQSLGLQWYGVFKSRIRTRAAFDALVMLLGLIGHPEPVRHLPDHPRTPGARLTGFRRISSEISATLDRFLSGTGHDALVPLTRDLLEKPSARRDAGDIQQWLIFTKGIWNPCAGLCKNRTLRGPSFLSRSVTGYT